MEITEPVILRVKQGRKTVTLEIETRADARDLARALACRMIDLPDDGEGLLSLIPVVPAGGVVDAAVYCGARALWGEECTLEEHPADVSHVDTADRPWFDGEPAVREPCLRVHPDTGEGCIGLAGHNPPHRDIDGDEWVPAGEVVTA